MHRQKSSLLFITVLLIALAVLAAAGLAMLMPGEAGGGAGGHLNLEPGKVYTGRLPGCENYPVNSNPGEFFYLVAQDVSFQNGEAAGNIMIENNPGNSYAMQVTFFLTDDVDQTLYTSVQLDPGEYIYCDYLDETLEKGSYDITAKVEAVAEDGTVVGAFEEYITFTIEK